MQETEEVLESIAAVEKEDAKIRRLVQDHKREVSQMQKAIDDLNQRCAILTAIDNTESNAPTWMSPKPSSKGHRAIANLILSDLHLDEVVKPQEVSGVNAYDRKIATFRLRRTFEKFITIGRDFLRGFTYDGAHIWMLGDCFSGNIHEELKRTNEAPIMASLDYWVDPMVAGLRMVVDEYGKLHISGRVGNHGRNTLKPIMKGRIEDNFDWLFYRILQRELRSDKRITWDLPLSSDGEVITQYKTRYLATHGDQFRGGSGISGIQTPLNLGNFRKTRRQLAFDDPYDYMLIGHFHQYMSIPNIVVNGSLKGYDEYAYNSNFGFEPPKQAFWVNTPEHGPFCSLPIEPMDRKAEKW